MSDEREDLVLGGGGMPARRETINVDAQPYGQQGYGYVPVSGGKKAMARTLEAAISMGTGAVIYRR